MAKTIYIKKIKNGKEYYFYRLRHKNLRTPTPVLNDVKEIAANKLNNLYKTMGQNSL